MGLGLGFRGVLGVTASIGGVWGGGGGPCRILAKACLRLRSFTLTLAVSKLLLLTR